VRWKKKTPIALTFHSLIPDFQAIFRTNHCGHWTQHSNSNVRMDFFLKNNNKPTVQFMEIVKPNQTSRAPLKTTCKNRNMYGHPIYVHVQSV
jgi:hypothetical protein